MGTLSLSLVHLYTYTYNIMDLSSNALAKESIAYRFESQSTIDDAKEQRDEEWKAAYERYIYPSPPSTWCPAKVTDWVRKHQIDQKNQ
jgi:hypothetical protein